MIGKDYNKNRNKKINRELCEGIKLNENIIEKIKVD